MVEDLQQEAAKTYLVSPIFQTLEVDISSRQVEAGAVEEVLIFSPRSSIQIKAEGDQVGRQQDGDIAIRESAQSPAKQQGRDGRMRATG